MWDWTPESAATQIRGTSKTKNPALLRRVFKVTVDLGLLGEIIAAKKEPMPAVDSLAPASR